VNRIINFLPFTFCWYIWEERSRTKQLEVLL